MWLFSKPATMPSAADALPGRPTPIVKPGQHTILGTPIGGPYPEGFEIAEFALGCFWGEEKAFWEVPGVWTTAVGYEGGLTPNPTYQEVCTGRTGQAESVRIVYDPSKVSYEQLLKVFWESHDPTQGMRQGNDVGTQYRSAIFVQSDAQRAAAEASKAAYQAQLTAARYGQIQTEIVGPPAPTFYFAEDYHQQYLDKVPNGYCPNHSTGVTLPTDFEVTPLQYVD
ncbi:MAG TPA: peptide-methionine (S)-S-oxide reductase MsrA [Candidatus Limnocylindrales bacterium]|nr:peptide-methionine (S)-S-oxide reductase MsrA [Candidatus Limnocylindrales bacterium]